MRLDFAVLDSEVFTASFDVEMEDGLNKVCSPDVLKIPPRVVGFDGGMLLCGGGWLPFGGRFAGSFAVASCRGRERVDNGVRSGFCVGC